MLLKNRELFDKELNEWKKEGWIFEHNEKTQGRVTGVIALQAKDQSKKKEQLRPVRDFSELKDSILSFPGVHCAVCPEKTRAWR